MINIGSKWAEIDFFHKKKKFNLSIQKAKPYKKNKKYIKISKIFPILLHNYFFGW